jgi:hypothetical protein
MKKFLLFISIAGLFTSCVKPMNDGTTQIILQTITFNKDTVMLTAGDVQQLDVKYAPSNFNNKTIVVTSSDTTVLSISENGSIRAKKNGKVTITVKTSDATITATCIIIVLPAAPPVNASQLPDKATDIGVGANGAVFITSTDSVSPTGGYSIKKWNGNNWVTIPECAAVRIGVGPDGTPWVINKSHLIFNNPGLNLIWNQLPGKANDIAVGAEGSVYIIGTDSVSSTGGYSIKKWNDTAFVTLPECAAVRIAVGPDGRPWVVNKSHLIYRYNGTGSPWTLLPGSANDIGIGKDGSVYITSTTLAPNGNGYLIQKWNGYGWTTLNGISGLNISVGSDGTPWWVDASHSIFKN